MNNGSTDDTKEKAEPLANKVLNIDKSTVSKARNLGAEMTKYELIAFIDGDVEITPKWTKNFIDRFNDLNDSPLFLTGSQCDVPQDSSWIEQIWFSKLKDQYLGSANMITTKIAFAKLKGFDENLRTGEDYDLCIRALKNGHNFETDPSFEAIHLGFPKDIKNFMKREKWHGIGDFQTTHAFFKSIVAQIAVLSFLLHIVVATLLILELYSSALATLTAILALNLAVTAKRFEKHTWSKEGPSLLVLNYLYFCARFASLFSAIKIKQTSN